jgi:hypothetical protein
MPLQFSRDEPATPESAAQARQLLEDQQWYADHTQGYTSASLDSLLP